MYPNVQFQLYGSRLETVNNEVIQQNPNSCGVFCFYFALKFFDNTNHLYIKNELEPIRVMSSFLKKKTFITKIFKLFKPLINRSYNFQV